MQVESHRSKKLSKLYRKIVTSDETRAMIIFNGLDKETKEEILQLIQAAGSDHILHLFKEIS